MRAFLAVDWGTTNRRAYHVGADGQVAAEHEDGLGILSVEDFPAAVAELTGRFGELPVLMGGMIGSNRGWVEAPYAPAPAGLDDLAQAVKWVEPGRIGIVPGVSYRDVERCDVMRGEEVQILGAVAEGLLPPDGLLCHPGTHNKWIRLEGGRITAFRTIMTGELFNLLRKHSILSDLLQVEADGDSSAFAAGVEHGLARDDLLSDLFAVRARVLLGAAEREDAASYVSGLLIGSDLRVGLGDVDTGAVVPVVARPELTALFAKALRLAGREATELDGERAFVAGLKKIAEIVL
jgi:2-dehydro-3-deoxygalactonokinase